MQQWQQEKQQEQQRPQPANTSSNTSRNIQSSNNSSMDSWTLIDELNLLEKLHLSEITRSLPPSTENHGTEILK